MTFRTQTPLIRSPSSNAIAEKAEKPSQDRRIYCMTCDGATRAFDDPAECPDCHGERYVVL